MMGWYQGDWGFAGMLGMGMMVLLWGALIWLAVWAIARFTRTDRRTPGPSSPHERSWTDVSPRARSTPRSTRAPVARWRHPTPTA